MSGNWKWSIGERVVLHDETNDTRLYFSGRDLVIEADEETGTTVIRVPLAMVLSLFTKTLKGP